MKTLSILGLIAASITVIGFIYTIVKKIKKNINALMVRVEEIELSLKTKQNFLIPKGKKVIIDKSNHIIVLETDEIIVVDKIEGIFIFGNIFYNSVYVKVSIYDIENEK